MLLSLAAIPVIGRSRKACIPAAEREAAPIFAFDIAGYSRVESQIASRDPVLIAALSIS